MGKVRVKPTRIVAKSKAQQHSIPPSDVDFDSTPLPKIPTVASNSKISKTGKRRRLKTSKIAKKSVTFPSNNLTQIISTKKETCQELLKKGAGALLSLVAKDPKFSELHKKVKEGKPDLKSNSLNKIIKNQFKGKKTRKMLRKEAFRKKLSLVKGADAEAKAEKKRKETVIIGDMQPMSRILEELEEETMAKEFALPPSSSGSTYDKKMKKFSVKKREKEMLDALKFLETVGL